MARTQSASLGCELNLTRRSEVTRELLRGKSIGRSLTNIALRGRPLNGLVMDVGGTNPPASHYRFLDTGTSRVLTANIDVDCSPDLVFDANRSMPLRPRSLDAVLGFNLVEHLHSPQVFFAESHRVLRLGGSFLGTVPFLKPVHGHPHDFGRYTSESLQRQLESAGFDQIEVLPIGGGPFTAALDIVGSFLPNLLRAALLQVAFVLDTVVRRFAPDHGVEKYPLAYVISARVGAL